MIDQKDIRVLAAFAGSLMDGVTVPADGSASLTELAGAVRGLINRDSDVELAMLGHAFMREVLQRVQSGIAAERAIRSFGVGGGGPTA